jgi:pimeloyl-ACP methyl ester carboxylesterase
MSQRLGPTQPHKLRPGQGVRKAAHRALHHALQAFIPADGATPYRPAVTAENGTTFFAVNGPPAEFVVEQVRTLRRGRRRMQRKRFAFPSPARTGVGDNDTVRGYWVQPLDRDVQASLVFLHNWKAASLRPVLRVARHALKRGVEVFIPAQPYHAWRRPKMTYSGLPFLSPDLDRTMRAMRQAVMDVRSLAHWIQARRTGPLLLAGMELGGLVAALTATVHEGLDGLVVIGAQDRVSELLWQGQADRGRFRRAMQQVGLEQPALDQAWSVLDPAWRPPRLPLDRILLIEGRYNDNHDGLRRLASRWGGAQLSTHDFAQAEFPFFARPIMREALALVGVTD